MAAQARFEELARLNGGMYFEARDEVALTEAIATSLATPDVRFEVLDVAGVLVAEGLVDGDAVSLPAGRYRLRVAGVETTVSGISVRSEATTTFVLEGGR